MSLLDTVALTSIRGLPRPVQSRIFMNKQFQSDVEINGGLAQFDDAGRIRLGDLLDAVRQVYETGKTHTIQNLDGDDVHIEMNDGRAVISCVGDQERDKAATPFELAVLAPTSEIRLDALSFVCNKFGITGPNASLWKDILDTRAPSNDEVSQMNDEMARSVPNWWDVTTGSLSSGDTKPEDLVPTFDGFFTALCGPLPDDLHVDEYIRGPLASHRRELLSRGLSEGLSLSLLGSLRTDTSLVPDLENIPDDELWEAASRLENKPDPFTLLGLVEIALARRQTKPEFGELAERLVERLCAEALPRHDGMDVYEIFSALVGLTLRRVRHIDGAMRHPPYWHWLCAFTHAGLLTRLLDGLDFDPKEMSDWLEQARERSDGLADILALRNEPTWRFDLLSRERIQAEVVGRLKGLAQEEGAQGRNFPNIDLLNERIEQLIKIGISPYRPGPLEGNLRPLRQGPERAIPGDEADKILAALRDTPNDIPWTGIDNISATFFLPDDLRAALSDALLSIELPQDDFSMRTNTLATAALVAATHLDRNITEAISERLFQEFKGEDDTQTAFLVLLMASTAIEDEEWLDWFTEKLYRLAHMAPAGVPLKVLSILINELKTLLPVAQWRFGRIEALCEVTLDL